jgi:molecular chaperone DnaK (HSP70)
MNAASTPSSPARTHEGDEPIVGIDLGTTNSLVAILGPAGPRILRGEPRASDGANQQGDALLPSVVRYERDGRVLVGAKARAEAPDHPRTTVASVKRLMGRSVGDAAGDLAHATFAVEPGPRGTAQIVIPLGDGQERRVSPEEVSAEVLRALKARAQAALGREVRKAVVTVPAYFDDAQRQATRVAGRLAGLDVVRIVPEPTAAALAYGLGLGRASERNATARTIVVYDLGGGTFDVSVLRITPAHEAHRDAYTNAHATTDTHAETGTHADSGAIYQVLATSGDTRLGGDDFDHLILGVMQREIAAILGADGAQPVDLPAEARRGMLALAERVKVRLSDADRATVRVDLSLPDRPARVYQREFTRAEFEAMIAPLVERTIACCAAALRDAGPALPRDASGKPMLDAVVLVGGSTRVPLVRASVAEFFGVEPYAAIDPDLVVALGAAVQGGVLSGAAKGTLLLDVIPLSLGVETVGGAVAKLILRNSPVPARAMERFSTSVDGQTSFRLTVYQGEREMAADCRKLGEFRLAGLPPMPAGIPQLEVTFVVDANGVLTVAAYERRSGRRARMQVVPNHGLTSDEVDRIERDSVTHARDDMKRHRVVDLIANASLDLKWIGEALARVSTPAPHASPATPQLDPAYRADLEARIDALRAMVQRAKADWRDVDANEFHKAKEVLDAASVRLQEVAIARSLASTASPAAQATGTPKEQRP